VDWNQENSRDAIEVAIYCAQRRLTRCTGPTTIRLESSRRLDGVEQC